MWCSAGSGSRISDDILRRRRRGHNLPRHGCFRCVGSQLPVSFAFSSRLAAGKLVSSYNIQNRSILPWRMLEPYGGVVPQLISEEVPAAGADDVPRPPGLDTQTFRWKTGSRRMEEDE